METHENHRNTITCINTIRFNSFNYIFSLSGQEMKTSPIDSTIIDFILTHYNTLSLQGKPAILTSEQFDDLVVEAKEHYYNKLLKEHDENIRN